MDKPTRNLDPETSRYIEDLILERNALAARVAILEDILGHVKRHLSAAQGLILI